jgi:hypothetical protein
LKKERSGEVRGMLTRRIRGRRELGGDHRCSRSPPVRESRQQIAENRESQRKEKRSMPGLGLGRGNFFKN